MTNCCEAVQQQQSLQEQGNQLYKAGDYLRAAAAYTKAIKQDPQNPVLFSNRSAALLKLNKLAKALADAEACVQLDSAFHKGWMRKGMVLECQGQLQEALDCFQRANTAVEGGNVEYAARIKVLRQKINSQQQAAKASKPPAVQAALKYAEGKLAYAREQVLSDGSSFTPELHFLHPGSSSSSSTATDPPPEVPGQPGMTELLVRAQHAFDAPDVLTMFVGEMRQQAQDLQATAAVLVAPKSAVAFPQTWRQQSWQLGQHDGVFVQLQALVPRKADDDTSDKGPRSSSDGGSSSSKAPTSSSSSGSSTVLNKTWFIRLRPNKPPSEPVEVGAEFGLLPPLLK